MKVRMTVAYTPITSYKLATELENVFSVKFGAIVTEDNNTLTVAIPFSDYWLEITRDMSSDIDDDIPAIIAKVGVTKLPNSRPILQYKSRSWIKNAKDFEKEVQGMLQQIGDRIASPEFDKLVIKVKKALSKVLSQFDSKDIRSNPIKTPPKVVHDEEE